MRLALLLAAGLATSLACAAGDKNADTEDETDPTADTTPVAHEGDDAGECSDAADNDRDGLFDCDDPECAGSPDCDAADTDTDVDADTDADGDTDTDTDLPDNRDDDHDGYTVADGDCDDEDSARSPGNREQSCNGVDDDCDAATEDQPDTDGDGISACDDCDDADPDVFPGADELCDNATDDDCDGDIDEDCDYSDTWTFDDTVSYSCAYGLVSISFNRAVITDSYPDIEAAISTVGTLSGSFSSATRFSADDTLSGSCTETFTLGGNFTSRTTLDATFSVTFTGGSACFDCSSQSWSLTGTR